MTRLQRVALINLANSSPFRPPTEKEMTNDRLIPFKDLPHVTQAEVEHIADKVILSIAIKYLQELLALAKEIKDGMDNQPWIDSDNIDYINKE